MTAYLLRDLGRRLGAYAVAEAAVVALLLVAFERAGWLTRWWPGIGLSVAAFNGWAVCVFGLFLAEIHIRPIDRPTWWHATLTACLVSAALMTMAQAVAASITWFTWQSSTLFETLPLTSLYTFVYAGLYATLIPLATVHNRTTATPALSGLRAPRVSAVYPALRAITIPLMLTGWILPIWFGRFLPVTVGDMPWWLVTSVTLATSVVVALWWWSPPPNTIPVSRRVVRPVAEGPILGQLPPTRRVDHLTGVWRLVLPAMGAYALICVLALLLFTSMDVLVPPHGERTFIDGLLIFSHDWKPNVMVLLLATSAADFGPWLDHLRRLRTLPLRLAGVTWLLIATCWASLVVLWLSLLAYHYVMSGGPLTGPRVDLFVAFGGLMTLAQAERIRKGPALRPFSGGRIVTIIALVFGVRFAGVVVPVGYEAAACIVAGAVLTCVGAAITYRVLAKADSRSPVYQKQALPLTQG